MRSARRAAAMALTTMLALPACQKPAPPPVAPPKFDTQIPVKELMGHMVAPGAEMYWKHSGVVIDKQGEHNLSPTTDEGWDVLVSGATILMEAGNTLQLDGRARAPVADWRRYAQALTARAAEARAAAERHDEAAVFEAGGRLDAACDDCHVRFSPGAQPRPAPKT